MPEGLLFDLERESEVVSNAVLSECGRYRYALNREWDARRPRVCFVMLNPSTADATVDDPTIRKCVGFARRWRYGGIAVVNLFAFRSTDPKGLRSVEDPVGPRNDWWIDVETRNRRVVVAWGGAGGALARRRAAAVCAWLGRNPLECLGVGTDGDPKHPLMLPYDTPLVPFEAKEG